MHYLFTNPYGKNYYRGYTIASGVWGDVIIKSRCGLKKKFFVKNLISKIVRGDKKCMFKLKVCLKKVILLRHLA